MIVPKKGDYVLLDGEYRQLNEVTDYSPRGVILYFLHYGAHYMHPHHKVITKEIYESPLYQALS